MEIIDCVQGDKAWDELRQLRMTASHATAIGNHGKGLESYINKMIMEYYSTEESFKYKNQHMERGNDLEDSAAFLYGVQTGIKTEKIGFVIHNDYVGCSPDLFCEGNGKVEIKCRDDKAYWKLLNDGKLDSSEKWQIQMGMLLCKKDWCDAIDYNPHFKKDLIINRIFPDESMFNLLQEGFVLGQELIEELMDKWGNELK